jgi:exopolyphosphatase / guanosine-5'-triphosphate,3'-diphosphate pyrophosphatase
MREMRFGVIDVGSNTTRLLVANAASDGFVPVDTQKVRLSLGEEIERHGAVSAVHVAAAAKAVRAMAAAARRKRVASLDVFLTAPGRQATNSAELVAALSRAARVQARVLTKEEEGTLAYRGAILTAGLALPARVAVCDVGGASTEIAVGDPDRDPDWIESVDLGSVRLTTRSVDMHAEAAAAFGHLVPPTVEAALVVGGSARAARRLVGAELGETELAEALQIVETTSPREVARRFGVDRARAEILPAGVILLAEVQRRLGVTLHVCGGGIREGAVLASLEALAA